MNSIRCVLRYLSVSRSEKPNSGQNGAFRASGTYRVNGNRPSHLSFDTHIVKSVFNNMGRLVGHLWGVPSPRIAQIATIGHFQDNTSMENARRKPIFCILVHFTCSHHRNVARDQKEAPIWDRIESGGLLPLPRPMATTSFIPNTNLNAYRIKNLENNRKIRFI